MGTAADNQAALPSVVLHPRLLDDGMAAPFDVYGRRGPAADFLLLSEAGRSAPREGWQAAARLGDGLLYAPGEVVGACLEHVEERLPGVVDAGFLAPDQEADWLYAIACRVVEALFSDPELPEHHRRAKRIARALAAGIRRNPGAAADILARASSVYSTYSHSVKVGVRLADFACAMLGTADADQLLEVALGGVLHDLGKCRIPREVLEKTVPLDEDDIAQLRNHPGTGLRLARSQLHGMPVAQHIIRQHHENRIGSGYPDGLTGAYTSRFARAARIVDTFDALTSKRPYGPAEGAFAALTVMANEMRGCFDTDMLRDFIRHLGSDRGEGESEPEHSVFDGPPISLPGSTPRTAHVADRVGPRVRDAQARRQSGGGGAAIRLVTPKQERPMDEHAGPPPEDAPAPASGFMAFHTRILRSASCPEFALFRRPSGGGALVGCHEAGEPVSAEALRMLEELRADVLYVPTRDWEACLDYVEEHLKGIMADAKLPSRAEAKWVHLIACRAVEALLEQSDDPAGFERVARAIGAMVISIARSPGAAWTMALDRESGYGTHVHSVNVAALLTDAARNVLDVADRGQLGLVALGGALHDLGKTAVPDDVLEKPGALTAEEFEHVKRHPRVGFQMAEPYIRGLSVVEAIIVEHHEDASGTGYPVGLAGEDINEFARLARIVDTFDALRHRRRYGRTIDSRTALVIMADEMPGRFDAYMLAAFAEHARCMVSPVAEAEDRSPGRGRDMRDFVEESDHPRDVVYRYSIRRAGSEESVPQHAQPDNADDERQAV
jgi:HD-GYP domain-containing protein (c-di-GMP phosphodiesterase class II)